jgi:hypothetical protein
MTREYYYLDTNYILAYLAYKHPEHFKNVDINPTESRLANSVIGYLTPEKIKMPLFVLAELVTQLKEKNAFVGIDLLIGYFEIAMISALWPNSWGSIFPSPSGARFSTLLRLSIVCCI